MTEDETLKELIEDLISAMEYHVEQTRQIHSTTVALQAARETLKSLTRQRTEQEPVAEAYALADKVRTELDKKCCPVAYMNVAWEAVVTNYRDLIHTTPPKRPWVGLANHDWNSTPYSTEFRAGAEWAEAILEKNT